MNRRLIRIAAAGSLVLCLATTFFWTRSYWQFDEWGYTYGDQHDYGDGATVLVRSEYGDVGLARCDRPAQVLHWGRYYTTGRASGRGVTSPLYGWEGDFDRFNFQGGGFLSQITGLEWWVIVPHWFLALLTAMPGLVFLCAWRRWSRPRRGLCSSCGYDLRATLDRGPECGNVPNRILASN